jgi:uncharacterized protein (TIGR00645 family)
MKTLERIVERFIFFGRWFQAPMYVGLVVIGFVYAYKFMMELVHIVSEVGTLSEEAFMLGVLTLVDITMVANVLIMVIIGGYATFVSRLPLEGEEDKPDWLQRVDAGTMKVKLAASLVGISAIHLLKSFINITNKEPEQVMMQVIIHAVFVVSALLLAVTEWVLKKKAAIGYANEGK